MQINIIMIEIKQLFSFESIIKMINSMKINYHVLSPINIRVNKFTKQTCNLRTGS